MSSVGVSSATEMELGTVVPSSPLAARRRDSRGTIAITVALFATFFFILLAFLVDSPQPARLDLRAGLMPPEISCPTTTCPGQAATVAAAGLRDP